MLKINPRKLAGEEAITSDNEVKSPTDPFPIVSPRWAVPWSVFPLMPAFYLALPKGVKIDFRAPTGFDPRFSTSFS